MQFVTPAISIVQVMCAKPYVIFIVFLKNRYLRNKLVDEYTE